MKGFINYLMDNSFLILLLDGNVVELSNMVCYVNSHSYNDYFVEKLTGFNSSEFLLSGIITTVTSHNRSGNLYSLKYKIDFESEFNGEYFCNQIVNVDDEKTVADKFTLSQNYPNPFNPTTKIRYTIPAVGTRQASSTNVKLEIFNTLGQKIKTLVNEPQTAGTYEVEFNGNNIPSGVYFYKLTNGSFSETKKMVFLK